MVILLLLYFFTYGIIFEKMPFICDFVYGRMDVSHRLYHVLRHFHHLIRL